MWLWPTIVLLLLIPAQPVLVAKHAHELEYVLIYKFTAVLSSDTLASLPPAPQTPPKKKTGLVFELERLEATKQNFSRRMGDPGKRFHDFLHVHTTCKVFDQLQMTYHGINTLSYTLPQDQDSLGNYLSHYWEVRAIAQNARIPFISVVSAAGPSVMEFMPESVIPWAHSREVNRTSIRHNSKNAVRDSCRKACGSPHECAGSHFVKNLGQIQLETRRAAVLYAVDYFYRKKNSTSLVNATSLVSIPAERFVSTKSADSGQSFRSQLASLTSVDFAEMVAPDIAIHLRCGDILHIRNDLYALNPFSVYTKRIDSRTKSVYILSDPIDRKVWDGDSDICTSILQALEKHIHSLAPSATVVIARGGDPSLAFAQLSLASLCICSVSTFCLWASVGSTDAHLPVSKLFFNGKGQGITSAAHWHWFEAQLLHSGPNGVGKLRGRGAAAIVSYLQQH